MFGETIYSYPVYITNDNLTEISNLLDILKEGYKKAYVGGKWAAVKEFGNGYGITIKKVDMDYNNLNEITAVDIDLWSDNNPNSFYAKTIRDVKIGDVESKVSELYDLSNKAIEVQTKMNSFPHVTDETRCYINLNPGERMTFEDDKLNKIVVALVEYNTGKEDKHNMRYRFVVTIYGDTKVTNTGLSDDLKFPMSTYIVAAFGSGDDSYSGINTNSGGVVIYKTCTNEDTYVYTVSISGNVEVNRNKRGCW